MNCNDPYTNISCQNPPIDTCCCHNPHPNNCCCCHNPHADNCCCKALKCICEILQEYKAKEPSYATFWQTAFVTVNLNAAFPFNFTGPATPDITLTNPTTITVAKAGVYQISYRVSISVASNSNPNNYVDQRISLYVNSVQQPNSQTGFGIYAPDITSCVPISGDAIIFIPANATLQLKNDGIYTGSSSITTCDNGTNAVTFSIIKIG
ncbi:MAG: hypothetical protein RR915_06925 [Cellulosilyticaceae bacterium]